MMIRNNHTIMDMSASNFISSSVLHILSIETPLQDQYNDKVIAYFLATSMGGNLLTNSSRGMQTKDDIPKLHPSLAISSPFKNHHYAARVTSSLLIISLRPTGQSSLTNQFVRRCLTVLEEECSVLSNQVG